MFQNQFGVDILGFLNKRAVSGAHDEKYIPDFRSGCILRSSTSSRINIYRKKTCLHTHKSLSNFRFSFLKNGSVFG